MDKQEQIIRAGLKRLASQHGPDMLFDGTVLSVDSENYFAHILLDTGETIYECRLRAASVGNKSIDPIEIIKVS